MGRTYVRMEIANPERPGKREAVEALVDTGATYSLVPQDVLSRIGLTPVETAEFETADGRLINVIVLGSMALQVDPVSRQLRPAKLILYS
jgi:predicted aspartyl protease